MDRDKKPPLSDVRRRAQNIEHELDDLSQESKQRNDPFGPEITLAMRKAQELILFLDKAIEKGGK